MRYAARTALLALAVTLPAMAPAQEAGQEGAPAAVPAAEADSAYGCRRLSEARPFGVMEGADGAFFRMELDLRTRHPLSEATAARVGALSRALEARGTTLVYAPVPTKSLAMPQAVPAAARRWGYEGDRAAASYDRFVERLRKAGVRTVDLRRPLAALEGEAPAFIGTDFHWSSAGARAAARAVAERIAATEAAGDLPEATHMTEATGRVALPSELRRIIQARCRQTVPAAETVGMRTRVESSDASGGIFADETRPGIALVGTSLSDLAPLNFAGFLGEAAGTDVANYAITGGNQFGSITSYLLSDTFAENPPVVLVWENPVYNNLGEFGARPLIEMTAAARDACRPVETRRADGWLVAEPGPGAMGPDTVVRVSGGTVAREATVRLVTDAGIARAATIRRTERLDPTPRFYQQARPVWSSGIARIEARLDRPFGPDAGLALCTLDPGTDTGPEPGSDPQGDS